MPIYIALLRGINVGGNKKIKMEDLRALCQSLGWVNVRTLLQSGNVVFESDITDHAALIQPLEQGIEAQFGFHSDVMLRTADDVQAIVRCDPLSDEQPDPSKWVVMFLSAAPDAAAVESLRTAYTGPESIEIVGQDAFLYYPDGQGRSKLTNALIERHLRVSGTARNWNTVTKLAENAG